MSWVKGNPVRAFSLLLGLLFAFDAYVSQQHLLSHGTLAWLGLAEALGSFAAGFFGIHNVVTPVVNPKAADGTPLVPAP